MSEIEGAVSQDEWDNLDNSEKFKEAYGFEHDCTCMEDWENENVTLVTKCFITMVGDALDRLKELNAAQK